ncbi:MAG: DNA starvation/stationary phase protection protein Dps [Chloroflexota bacterium]
MNPTLNTYKTTVDLDVTTRSEMIALLNQQLADSLDLYSQSKQAHWNVKGMHFIALHELFDQVAEAVEGTVDTIAERVTALGADAQGTVRMSATNSTLPEFPGNLDTSEMFVNAMIERVGAFANSSRRAATLALEAGDEVTGDVFVEITREMDKYLYFLEAHIQ